MLVMSLFFQLDEIKFGEKFKITFHGFAVETNVGKMSSGLLRQKLNFKFTIAQRFHLIRNVVAVAADAYFEAALAGLSGVHAEHVWLEHKTVSQIVDDHSFGIVRFDFERRAFHDVITIGHVDVIRAQLVGYPFDVTLVNARFVHFGHVLLTRRRFDSNRQVAQIVHARHYERRLWA